MISASWPRPASASSSCTPAARWRRRRSLELFARPAHPYTRGLLASIARGKAGGARASGCSEIPGMVPSLREPIRGCAFAPRCQFADAIAAAREAPDAARRSPAQPAHLAACLRAGRGAGVMTQRPARREPPCRSSSRSDGLKKYFPVRRGLLQAHGRRGQGRRRRLASRSRAGETLCLVGESGLRQVDRRPADPAPDRADRRHHRLRGRGHHAAVAARRMRIKRKAHADRVPGPLCLAQPAPDRGHHRRRAARELRAPRPRRARGRVSPQLFARVGLSAGCHAPVSLRILGRPAPAPRHRARAGALAVALSSPTSRFRRSTSPCRRRC